MKKKKLNWMPFLMNWMNNFYDIVSNRMLIFICGVLKDSDRLPKIENSK